MSNLTEMMSPNGQAPTTAQPRENIVMIESLGVEILFVEPSEAQTTSINSHLKWGETPIDTDTGAMRPCIDFAGSKLDKYKATLIACTAYDPESKAPLYKGTQDCQNRLFTAKNSDGKPKFSREVIGEIEAAALAVLHGEEKN